MTSPGTLCSRLKDCYETDDSVTQEKVSSTVLSNLKGSLVVGEAAVSFLFLFFHPFCRDGHRREHGNSLKNKHFFPSRSLSLSLSLSPAFDARDRRVRVSFVLLRRHKEENMKACSARKQRQWQRRPLLFCRRRRRRRVSTSISSTSRGKNLETFSKPPRNLD